MKQADMVKSFTYSDGLERGVSRRPVRMHPFRGFGILRGGMVKSFGALAVLTMLLVPAGCTLSPEYSRPETPVSGTFAVEDAVTGNTDESVSLPVFDDFFVDPVQKQLVALALENNRDLREALMQVERTRAMYRITRADRLPSVSVGGASPRIGIPATELTEHTTVHSYSVGVGFTSFELDLFGRVKELSREAMEQYLSAEESVRAARLSLAAETAGLYLQLVADREIEDIARDTVQNRQQELDLLRTLAVRGLVSELEVSQAETLLHEAEGNATAATVDTKQTGNALVRILGTELPSDLPEVRKIAEVASLPDVPAGLPSDLLERRPDILAAEHSLKAVHASIGAARANFFPRISLTGGLGKLSREFDELWEGSSKTWVFLPQIVLPIFDFGRNKAALEVAEADRDLAVARYENAVQTAFREVNDALVQRAHMDEQLTSQNAMLAASEKSREHANARFLAGLAPWLNVLETERTLFAARRAGVDVRLLRESTALKLYKALGGGWNEEDDGRSGSGVQDGGAHAGE